MRTASVSGMAIQYPDIVSFCFNPVVINVSSASCDHIIMTVTCGTVSVNEKRELFGSACFFDASFYMQSMFDKSDFSVDYSTAGAKDSGMGKLFSIELDFVKNGVIDDSYQLTTFCVWGAMQIGGRYNGDRTVKWFKNYPFTLGMYTAAAATLSYKLGG